MSDDDLEYRLQARIEPDPQRLRSYGPGPYVYWALSRYVTNVDDILFADLAPDVDRTNYSERTGAIFLVTVPAVLVINYENAVGEPQNNPAVGYGTLSVQIYPWSEAERPTVRWATRDLQIYKTRQGRGDAFGAINIRAIECSGSGWTYQLPGIDVVDGDAYFAELLRAFKLL